MRGPAARNGRVQTLTATMRSGRASIGTSAGRAAKRADATCPVGSTSGVAARSADDAATVAGSSSAPPTNRRRVGDGGPPGREDVTTRATTTDGAGQSSFRMCGNRITSRMFGESVSSITSRSMPTPHPPVGGMPYSSARM